MVPYRQYCIWVSIVLILVLFYAVMAIVNMDLNKGQDTILYAKFLTRIEDKVRWLWASNLLIDILIIFLLLININRIQSIYWLGRKLPSPIFFNQKKYSMIPLMLNRFMINQIWHNIFKIFRLCLIINFFLFFTSSFF